jgi:Spy/CpxP family protein refolding chaperone
MKSRLFLFAAIVSIIMITGSIFSQENRRGDRDGFKYRERIEERLKLTDEQSAKIEALKLDHRKEMIDLRADVEKKEIEMQELKNNPDYSRDDFLKKVNDIISAKNKIELARANHQMDVYQILDADQKKEWNKLGKNFHERKYRSERRHRDRICN